MDGVCSDKNQEVCLEKEKGKISLCSLVGNTRLREKRHRVQRLAGMLGTAGSRWRACCGCGTCWQAGNSSSFETGKRKTVKIRTVVRVCQSQDSGEVQKILWSLTAWLDLEKESFNLNLPMASWHTYSRTPKFFLRPSDLLSLPPSSLASSLSTLGIALPHGLCIHCSLCLEDHYPILEVLSHHFCHILFVKLSH